MLFTIQNIIVIYNINNDEFLFKIPEVNVINEYENYLLSLVHEIGLKLRCSATCTALRCIRYSSFNINQALLMKHWSLQYVLDNIKECNSSYNKINHSSAFVSEQSQLEINQNMTNVQYCNLKII